MPASRSEVHPGCSLHAAPLSTLHEVALPMQRPRPSKSQLQRASRQMVPSVNVSHVAGSPWQPRESL